MTWLAQQAQEAAQRRRAQSLEEWLRDHRELWPEFRAKGWFTETLDRLEAEG